MCYRTFITSLLPFFFKKRRKQEAPKGNRLTNQELINRGYAKERRQKRKKGRPARFVHKTYIDGKAKRCSRIRRRMQKLSRRINRNLKNQ